MKPISVVIITHNEEKNIARSLTSVLKISSDVIVVDSFSTDTTAEICKKYPVKFVQRKWDGYSLQKNYGNDLAANDWILSIDADEELSEALVDSIKREFKNPSYDCYEMNFRTNFCGQWLRFGHWNPDKHIRIFNKKNIQWDTNAVHEQLTISGSMRVGKLKGKMNHYTIQTLEQYRKKNDYYIELSAQKMAANNKKSNFIKLYFSPAYRFFHSYILKLGILDGYYGYVIARETARVAYLKYKKLVNS
jgi:glycosyltransferase involved in cell wall biosynthesis